VLGRLSFGFMCRSARAYRLYCLHCNAVSELAKGSLPLAFTLEECADLQRCPACNAFNEGGRRRFLSIRAVEF
jgi:hypothetical protein